MSKEQDEALFAIARAIHLLGNADASTPMGGMEALGKVLMEGLYEIAGALSEVAEAIRESK